MKKTFEKLKIKRDFHYVIDKERGIVYAICPDFDEVVLSSIQNFFIKPENKDIMMFMGFFSIEWRNFSKKHNIGTLFKKAKCNFDFDTFSEETGKQIAKRKLNIQIDYYLILFWSEVIDKISELTKFCCYNSNLANLSFNKNVDSLKIFY